LIFTVQNVDLHDVRSIELIFFVILSFVLNILCDIIRASFTESASDDKIIIFALPADKGWDAQDDE